MTEAETLLADVHSLRRRARLDRRASVFPLNLFAALILVAPLCYVPGDANGFQGPFPLFSRVSPFFPVAYPGLVGWFWMLSIVGGFAATGWWYRRRALRVGVETAVTMHLITAGAALAGFVLGVPLLRALPGPSLYSEPAVNLPILFGSGALAAAVLWWATRRGRAPVERTAAAFVGVLFATVAFSALGVYLLGGFAALLVIAAGLVTLAWLERNAVLAVVSLLFGGAALLVNLYNIENVFHRLGWELAIGQSQALALQRVLLPAAVLLVGALIGLRRPR